MAMMAKRPTSARINFMVHKKNLTGKKDQERRKQIVTAELSLDLLGGSKPAQLVRN